MDSTERMRLFREAKSKMDQIHSTLAEHVGYCGDPSKIAISPTVKVTSDYNELSFEIIFNYLLEKGNGHQEFKDGDLFKMGFVYDWLKPIGRITVTHTVETRVCCVEYIASEHDFVGVQTEDYLQQMGWLYTCAVNFYARANTIIKKLQLTKTQR